MADGEMHSESPEWASYNDGDLETQGSNLILRSTQSGPPAIRKLAHAGCSTRHRHFNPGLKGTNSIEATLLDYGAEGEYLVGEGKIAEYEDPVDRAFDLSPGTTGLKGWGISISNYHYLVQTKVQTKNETDAGYRSILIGGIISG